MIKLGDQVTDTVTGFKGIVIAETRWLNGCIRYIVQPKVDKEGKVPEAQSVDAPQLKVTKAGAFKHKPSVDEPEAAPGGPKDVPSRGPQPKRGHDGR